MQINQFAGLGLAPTLLRAIDDAGYLTPTPIQLQAIPPALAGRDLLAAAQTGTGKTAGFVLPILQRLSESVGPNGAAPGRPRCLILTPTRELAAQVEESVRVYGKHLPLKSMVMFGGVGIQPQIAQLRRRVDILVATPGRLLDHAGQRTVNLSEVEVLVLDEGDRMLDMGFMPDIKRVLALLPKKRQSMLFSATFSEEIRTLAHGLLNDPASIDVAPRNVPIELVEQTVHLVAKDRKRDLLSHLIREKAWTQVLVFTRTKHGANRLTEKLERDGIAAAAIHGNKSQAARTRALDDFKRGSIPVLVATDIAARGLDIEELPHVVNFELPNVAEDYVHRIGRTGRAGSTGAAVSLVEPEELGLLRAIEKLIKRQIDRVAVEGFDTRQSAVVGDPHYDRPRVHPRPQRVRNERDPRDTRGRKPVREHSGRPPARDHAARPVRDHAARAPARDHAARTHEVHHRHVLTAGEQHQMSGNLRAVEPRSDAELSEAARHQAQAQPALFSPPQQQRRRRG
jgi:ATP-dependent RNA helicase RhlE